MDTNIKVEQGDVLARKDLLGAIDKEIELQVLFQQKPGWTPWVLVVAVGAVAWQAIADWNPSFAPSQVMLICLTASVLFDSIVELHRLSAIESDWNKSPTRFSRMNLSFGGLRPSVTASTMRSLALLLAAFMVTPYPGYARPMLVVFYGTNSLLGVAGIFLSLLRLPIAVDKSPMWIKLALAPLLALPGFVGAWILTAGIVHDFAASSLPNIKEGVLLAVFLALVPKLAKEMQPLSVTTGLIRLRREVAFGKVPTDEARAAADRIVSGLLAEDVLEEDFSALVVSIAEQHRAIREARDAFAALRKITISGPPRNAEDFVAFNAVLSTLEGATSRVTKRTETVDTELKSIEVRVKLLGAIRMDRAAINKKLGRIRAEIKAARSEHMENNRAFKEWRAHTKTWEPTEYWLGADSQ